MPSLKSKDYAMLVRSVKAKVLPSYTHIWQYGRVSLKSAKNAKKLKKAQFLSLKTK